MRARNCIVTNRILCVQRVAMVLTNITHFFHICVVPCDLPAVFLKAILLPHRHDFKKFSYLACNTPCFSSFLYTEYVVHVELAIHAVLPSSPASNSTCLSKWMCKTQLHKSLNSQCSAFRHSFILKWCYPSRGIETCNAVLHQMLGWFKCK